MSRSAHQASHGQVLEALRGVLLAALQPGPGAGDEIDSILYRAAAALYSLLVDHPVDRRGRCRSCWRPGAVLGLRRGRCRVRGKAGMWLHLPAELLRSFLASELGLTSGPATHPGERAPGGSQRAGRHRGAARDPGRSAQS